MPFKKGDPLTREYGRRGGLKTKIQQEEKEPDWYSIIGLRGGLKVKHMFGDGFYSKIGKIGSRARKRPDGGYK